jgi:hypothetical protein
MCLSSGFLAIDLCYRLVAGVVFTVADITGLIAAALFPVVNYAAIVGDKMIEI